MREGRNASLNRPKKDLFQGFWGDLDEITMSKMFILPIEIVMVIEGQVLLNRFHYLSLRKFCLCWPGRFSHLVQRFFTS